MACVCGHSKSNEHGNDPKYPGSTACNVEDCDCVAYEWDGEVEDCVVYEWDGEGDEDDSEE